jgi:hypothetical protein
MFALLAPDKFEDELVHNRQLGLDTEMFELECLTVGLDY